jgi:CRISPR-associated exonuclease Cas4
MDPVDGLTFEVTDLKQWSYCPRIVFYRFCLPRIRPVTDLMAAGIRSHQDETDREERRSLRLYGLTVGERAFDLALTSTALGLRGRLDLAIAVPRRDAPGAEAVVVEYKESEEVDKPHFRRQLVAYALLLEEAWGLPVKHGFLYSVPLRRAVPVKITAALRSEVRGALAAMQRTVGAEQTPAPPTSRRQCVSCEFRRFCNDVV